jgi:hypothetical protein
LVSLQNTWHDPRQSTTQVVTAVHVMTLPGPARTPQRSTLSQSYRQLAPQKTPHETVLWQVAVQLSPHDAEQSFTSWHSSAHPLPQTPPQ